MRSFIIFIPLALLAFVLALTPACKTTDVANVVGSVGASLGVPGSEYSESVAKSAVAVSKSFEDFTPRQEYYIGRAVAAEVLSSYKPCANRAANEYVNLLGQSLAMYSDMPVTYSGYHFLILDSKEINAFAAPSGFIFVTSSLVKLCPDENALAAVLAHEIAHVEKKHALRSIKKSRITEAFAVMGGEAAKHATGSDLAGLTDIFTDSVSDIVSTMVVSGYSREYELEADAGAAVILERVGYDPAGLVVMLKSMEKNLTPSDKGFASTHPDPEERIDELTAVANVDTVISEPAPRQERFRSALGGV